MNYYNISECSWEWDNTKRTCDSDEEILLRSKILELHKGHTI